MLQILQDILSGLWETSGLYAMTSSVEGLKQERRSTFVIKKRMETKRFRLLVAASIS